MSRSPSSEPVDLTGHEYHRVTKVGYDPLGWQGAMWRATCECGLVTSRHRHPADAGMEATEHAVEAARGRPA